MDSAVAKALSDLRGAVHNAWLDDARKNPTFAKAAGQYLSLRGFNVTGELTETDEPYKWKFFTPSRTWKIVFSTPPTDGDLSRFFKGQADPRVDRVNVEVILSRPCILFGEPSLKIIDRRALNNELLVTRLTREFKRSSLPFEVVQE